MHFAVGSGQQDDSQTDGQTNGGTDGQPQGQLSVVCRLLCVRVAVCMYMSVYVCVCVSLCLAGRLSSLVTTTKVDSALNGYTVGPVLRSVSVPDILIFLCSPPPLNISLSLSLLANSCY